MDNFIKYSGHTHDCDMVNNFRPEVKARCTCGLEDILNALKDLGYEIDPDTLRR